MTPLSRLLSKTSVSSHKIARLAGLGFKRLMNITSRTKRSNFVSIFVGRKLPYQVFRDFVVLVAVVFMFISG